MTPFPEADLRPGAVYISECSEPHMRGPMVVLEVNRQQVIFHSDVLINFIDCRHHHRELPNIWHPRRAEASQGIVISSWTNYGFMWVQ
jgi:hypothetical protein